MSKVNSFKQLLLRKSKDASTSYLIKILDEEKLVDLMHESLEKMARASHKGRTANKSIRDFAKEMDPEIEPNMIHDALSHHASQYKAALGRDDQKLANEHAKKIFKIVDMADMAQGHSDGKLMIDAPSVQPWERHQKAERFSDRINELNEKAKNGTISGSEAEWLKDNPVTRGNKKPSNFVSDTKGWKYRGSDYSFLKNAPHDSAENETKKTGHTGAYPVENIRVNGKYLDISDIDPKELKGHESHPLDAHPIMDHFDEPVTRRGPERDEAFTKEHEAYKSSPHMDKYFSDLESKEAKDPAAFAARGSKKSNSVHSDPIIAQPSVGANIETAPDADAALASLPSEVQTRLKSKMNTAPTQPKATVEDAFASLPPHIQARLKSKMGQ
jgi:hypothetical protein